MVCAVILTALSVEYLAVRAHLTDLHEETNPQGTVYERGRFVASIQKWEVGIAEVGVGNSVAAIEAERAIAHFKPDILLFVGIAGGIKDVAIGDVVAATKIYGYESGKVDEQFLVRPALGQSTYLLVHRAKADAKKDEWLKRIYNKPASTPKVFVAPIAAGEKVVASKKSDVLQFLKTSYNDAIAIEMEGFGFLNAAFAHPTIQTIIIRGISDLIDGKSDNSVESEQMRQKKASDHASAFAFEILSQINSKNCDAIEVAKNSVSPISQPVLNPIIDFDAQSIEEIRNNYHNLPCPLYKEFVGREEDLKDLLNRISPEFEERTITIIGIGGVGKTSLALAAAYACLEASISGGDPSIPTFDLIIFSSAQLNTLLPKGIVNLNEIHRPIRTLQDLCVDIAITLNQSGLRLIDPASQDSALQEFLGSGNYKILIILDNLESLENEDAHKIYEFFKRIRGSHVKTVVTTRNSDRYDLNLKELSDSVSLMMINNLLIERGYRNIVDDEFCSKLNQMCGGIPLAIQYAIGVLAMENNPQKVLEKLSNPKGDLSQYCFDRLVLEIEKNNPVAYRLLLSLSVSPCGLTLENLFLISQIMNSQYSEAHNALNILNRCSLVFVEDGYYKMLPLTLRYSLSKLESNPELELEIREQWIKCYLAVAKTNGGVDHGEWHLKYDLINVEWKNFKEVFWWCQNHERYEDACGLWKALSRFAYLYGYWSDRLKWSNWIMDIASQRGDNKFLAEVKSACGWLALLREGAVNLEKAEELFKGAWQLNQHADPFVRNTIVINLAVLYTRKGEFFIADHWFKKYMELRRQGRQTIDQISIFNRKRLDIRYLLYWGERYYRDRDYVKAKRLYQQVTNKAEGIQWLRFKVKGYERLAYISIIENRISDAEELLNTWYPVTLRNRDYRRTAFFERDFARLEFEKKDYYKAKEWANKALEKFVDLNMIYRVETTNAFILECEHYLSSS